MHLDKFDFLIAIFCLILILSVIMNSYGIVFESSINIVELLSLIATIFIAAYFGTYLKKKEDVVSRNREVLLGYLGQIESKILAYKIEACSDRFDLISINSNNKNLNYLIGNIPILLTKIGIKDTIQELDSIKTHIKDAHRLLTFYKEEDVLDNVYLIENNIVTLNRDRRSQVESIFSDILFNIVCFKINLSKL